MDLFYDIPSSFTCLKEETRKGHPSFTSRHRRDTLRFSLLPGRKKTRLRLKQSESALTFYVLFRQQLRCSAQKKWGPKDKTCTCFYSHFTQGFLLEAGQVNGFSSPLRCWFVSLCK
jgi:hypothetical protein